LSVFLQMFKMLLEAKIHDLVHSNLQCHFKLYCNIKWEHCNWSSIYSQRYWKAYSIMIGKLMLHRQWIMCWGILMQKYLLFLHPSRTCKTNCLL
jgi:hypothetical protein